MQSASTLFRKKHLIQLLEGFEEVQGPLDYYVAEYFRAHKALGSKDRAYISESVYTLMRWKMLYDHLLSDRNWIEKLELFEKSPPEHFLKDPSIPLYVRLSFPEDLYREIEESLGPKPAYHTCLALNSQAPTCIRVNTQKISREKLLKRFQEKGFSVTFCKESEVGILFLKKTNFFSLPEFQEGLFEVQDEASQLVAQLLDAKEGNLVLDFCAGAGGKTLAFAEKLQGKGQIFLHDVRKGALLQAKKRLKRAGIQNIQLVHAAEEKKLEKLKKRMDWVFVDVPCSGTGTLRRNPDMKYKFSMDMLERLQGEQRTIFEKALSFVKPQGKIIYATCSILKKENQDQVEHFLKTYPIKLIQEPFQSIPQMGEKDGFFAAVFQKS